MNVVPRLLSSAMYLLPAILSLQTFMAVRAANCNGNAFELRSMPSVANNLDDWLGIRECLAMSAVLAGMMIVALWRRW